ncbi:hypothetical protein BKA69DRAFT_205248 [Paraphysoderma sedebokerense]|nr:hypothetical protein BKA69DRAFT_205248 [Paraphysoderma sedebokerense]
MLGKDNISSDGPISPTTTPVASNPTAADPTDCTPAKRPCESLTQIDHILQPLKKPKIQQSKIIDSLSLSLPSVSARDTNTDSHRPRTSNQHNSSPNKPLIELNSDDEDIVGLKTAHTAENQVDEESLSPPKKSTLIDYNSEEEFELTSNQTDSVNRQQINQGRNIKNDEENDFDMDRLLDLEESMLEEEEHRSSHDSFQDELQSGNGQQRQSHGDIFDSDDENVIKLEKADLMTQKKLNLEETDEDMDELFGSGRGSPQKHKPNPFMDKLNSNTEEPFNDRGMSMFKLDPQLLCAQTNFTASTHSQIPFPRFRIDECP